MRLRTTTTTITCAISYAGQTANWVSPTIICKNFPFQHLERCKMTNNYSKLTGNWILSHFTLFLCYFYHTQRGKTKNLLSICKSELAETRRGWQFKINLISHKIWNSEKLSNFHTVFVLLIKLFPWIKLISYHAKCKNLYWWFIFQFYIYKAKQV